jgi:hypothetical protein
VRQKAACLQRQAGFQLVLEAENSRCLPSPPPLCAVAAVFRQISFMPFSACRFRQMPPRRFSPLPPFSPPIAYAMLFRHYAASGRFSRFAAAEAAAADAFTPH